MVYISQLYGRMSTSYFFETKIIVFIKRRPQNIIINRKGANVSPCKSPATLCYCTRTLASYLKRSTSVQSNINDNHNNIMITVKMLVFFIMMTIILFYWHFNVSLT